MALDPLDPSTGGVRMKSAMKTGIMVIDDYLTRHPLRAGLRLIGETHETAADVARQMETRIDAIRIDRVPTVGGSTGGKDCATITFGGRPYLLGEIGVSYLAYHFNANNQILLNCYRERNWALFQTMINSAFEEYKKTEDFNIVCASVGDELLGIMKHYTSIKHREILDIIDENSLKSWVRYWRWAPTQMEIWLTQPIIYLKDRFLSGIKIVNGESGHRALSFEASLWSQSLGGDIDYEFTRPIIDRGYARHLHPMRIERVLGNLTGVMGEHKLQAAFEALVVSSGSTAAELVRASIRDDLKGSDTSKEKLLLALDETLVVPSGLSGIEVFYETANTAKQINKTAMKMAARACDQLLKWAGAE